MDSLDAFRSDAPMQRGSSLLMSLYQLRHRDWIVKIQRVSQDDNLIADSLAKVPTMSFWVVIHAQPPQWWWCCYESFDCGKRDANKRTVSIQEIRETREILQG
ncbi:hypothetical protein V6N12_020599 [Hibiscus sabdariffa]|uniref:RNase H type-1 domain-containing protein n=1 Tax=Hibiscus sabdariffa TaxID=183260 RepID=A0ABR2CYL2_9ROSI